MFTVRRSSMKRRLGVLGIVAAFALAVGVRSVVAHHSTTMFDHSKTLTLTGTVVEVHWVNPHVSLLVSGTVKDGDKPSDWLLEMTSPGNLMRAGGWSRTAVKPGDKVVIRSEEHTSELQSHLNIVCRLLLEKKKKK